MSDEINEPVDSWRAVELSTGEYGVTCYGVLTGSRFSTAERALLEAEENNAAERDRRSVTVVRVLAP